MRPDANGWLPIESANGETVIVWAGGESLIATRVADHWVAYVPATPLLFQPVLRSKPTLWQPLPLNPEGEG